jgi:predicted phosphoribosyltransferase
MPRFRNRREAGIELAAQLLVNHGTGSASRDRALRADLVVLGIPRGGIVVAEQVALALHAPLDVFITRKIGAPYNPELAIGAVTSDGTVFLDRHLIEQLHISQKMVERERDAQAREIARQLQLYRRNKPPLLLEGKTVILVDDGIATGATTFAALRALKDRRASSVVLAVPVAPRQVVPQLRAECDELVILDSPEPFVAVGYFFEDFGQVSDAQVLEILGGA